MGSTNGKNVTAAPIHTYWVRDRILLAGQYPGNPDPDVARRKIRHLLSLGVRRFIDLTDAGERTVWNTLGLLRPYVDFLMEEAASVGVTVEHLRMPIANIEAANSVAEMRAILDAIDASVAEGVPAYVHCVGGKGRTGTVIACHLIRHAKELLPPHAGPTATEALRHLIRIRREQGVPNPEDSPQRSVQFDFVRAWVK